MKLLDKAARRPALYSLLITIALAFLNWLPISSYRLQLVSEWSHIILVAFMIAFGPVTVFIIYHVLVFLFFYKCLRSLNASGRTVSLIFMTLFLIYSSPLLDLIWR